MYQKILLSCVSLICLLLSTGCAPVAAIQTQAGQTPQPMPETARIRDLTWKPTMTQNDFDLTALAAYGTISIALLSVDDVREDTRLIGKAYEDKKVRDKTVPIATKVNVAKWCKNSFEKAFQLLNIKSDPAKGRLRISIEISEFSIFDDFTQTGTATLRVTANNADEMMIWEGQIKASSDLYVHETQSDGISECLSNTALMVIYAMFTEQSFKDAVIKSL
jgi:hypothetical protein